MNRDELFPTSLDKGVRTGEKRPIFYGHTINTNQSHNTCLCFSFNKRKVKGAFFQMRFSYFASFIYQFLYMWCYFCFFYYLFLFLFISIYRNVNSREFVGFVCCIWNGTQFNVNEFNMPFVLGFYNWFLYYIYWVCIYCKKIMKLFFVLFINTYLRKSIKLIINFICEAKVYIMYFMKCIIA